MPNKSSKPDPADETHGALSSFSRNTTKANRICQEIADRQRALEIAEDAITAAVLILTPLLERQPRDTAFEYNGTVYWLDPTEGICSKLVRSWTDLLHQDDEPDETWQPYDLTTPTDVVPEHDPVHVTSRDGNGNVYISSVTQPVKPLSFGEQQARQRYEPLTDAQIDEGAFYEAGKAEPSMPDAVLEAMAEAWDRGDLDATQSIVNAVAANGRGA